MSKGAKTTQEIAADFALRASNAINNQLGVELKRLGLLAVIQEKKGKLIRTVASSKEDPRFVNETFSVEFDFKGKPLKRMIMNAHWTPSGYSIERYNEEMANAIVKTPDFKIKKGIDLDFAAMSKFDIDVEVLANKKMTAYNDKKAGLRKA